MRFEHPENKRVLTLRIAQNQICGRVMLIYVDQEGNDVQQSSSRPFPKINNSNNCETMKVIRRYRDVEISK